MPTDLIILVYLSLWKDIVMTRHMTRYIIMLIDLLVLVYLSIWKEGVLTNPIFTPDRIKYHSKWSYILKVNKYVRIHIRLKS